jgi:hypothetical protein
MKTTTKAGLAAILLFAISCKKENTNRISTQTTNNSTSAFTIGQRYGGGIIFYIDSTGQHGLIADTADLPQAIWCNPLNNLQFVTGATGTGIGKGKANTRKIVKAQGDSGVYAARECWKSRRSGYKDWFLPSRDELWEMNKQRAVLTGIVNALYWTSTESTPIDAWLIAVCCDNWWEGEGSKQYSSYVRAIRAF